jgi:DNA-binding CsgD family transcriptional regulator
MDNIRTNVNVTSREKQILRLIAREYSTAEISDLLRISSRTVETHRKNINRKTKARSLAGLTKVAIKLGLLDEYSYVPSGENLKESNIKGLARLKYACGIPGCTGIGQLPNDT